MKIKNLSFCVALLVSSALFLVSCSKEQAILDDGTPVITGFSPQQGKVGEEVTIKGINIGDEIHNTLVEFNSANARVLAVTPTEVIAIVPSGATTGPIVVETKSGRVTSAQSFSVDDSDDLNFPGTKREGAVSFVLRGKGYVGSGAATTQHLTDLWEYDFTTTTWTQRAEIPSLHTRGFSFVLDGKAYVGSGFIDPSLWQYDPTTDTWVEKAAIDSEAERPVSLVINGRVFVGTGQDGLKGVSSFREYLPDTDEWVARASVPGGGRRYAVGFALDGKGYVGLGMDDDNQTLTDMYEYDPTTDTWTQKADFANAGLYGAEAFVIDGKAYVGLGNDGQGFIKDIWGYDPQADRWSSAGKFAGSGRYRATSFVVGDVVYIGTGYDEVNTLSDFWRFKP